MKKVRLKIAALFFFISLSCMLILIRGKIESYDNQNQINKLKKEIVMNAKIKDEAWRYEKGEQESKNDQNEVDNKELDNHKKDKVKEILPQFQKLKEMNSDYLGWITIEGTSIDYPVMHRQKDNKFYLDHNFVKEKSRYGSLFLDGNCNPFLPTTNLIIYGHNMRDGSMFGSILKYKDERYYKLHKIIHFNTYYEVSDYEIVAVFLSEVYNKDEKVFKYYQFIEANSKKDYDDFINNIKKLSLYNTDVTSQYHDQLLTLSTCDYTKKNGRMAIVAKKIK